MFLSGTLLYSYQYVQNVIFEEADNHLLRLKQLLVGNLRSDQSKLQRYATIVARDLRLKEYLFVVTGIGGDSQPLENLYERQFGWLPIYRRIILSDKEEILVGKNHVDLALAIRKKFKQSESGIFYFQGKTGFEVVAVMPIKYRGNIQGRVAVTLLLGEKWLQENKKISGGEFFMVQDHEIINTTLGSGYDAHFRIRDGNHLMINGNPFRMLQIELSENKMPHKYQLWFGLSEADLLLRLDQHQRFILTLVGAGVAGVLLMGILIIRNFSGPLLRLIKVTHAVSEGALPKLKKSKVRNEVDELSNYFADMLLALRDKQDEIQKTHEKLEKSAITDTLTGLYNRRCLQEIFPKLLSQAKRDNLCVFGILLDLDYFKKVNDTYGHIVGDHCLVHFSKIVQQEARDSDYIFRLGGEEFLVLTVSENIMAATSFADKIRKKIESVPLHAEEALIQITVSGGVSYANPKGSPETTLNQMLSRADIALYQAKHAGRNRICASSAKDNSKNTQHQGQV